MVKYNKIDLSKNSLMNQSLQFNTNKPPTNPLAYKKKRDLMFNCHSMKEEEDLTGEHNH